MAGMKQAAIHNVLITMEEGDEAEIVFGGAAKTEAANILLTKNRQHFVDLSQPETAIMILLAVASSKAWESRNNRTYQFVAGRSWNGEGFFISLGRYLESIEVVRRGPREVPMDRQEMLETIQLLEPTDTGLLQFRRRATKDAVGILMNVWSREGIALDHFAVQRLLDYQRSGNWASDSAEARTIKFLVTGDVHRLAEIMDDLVSVTPFEGDHITYTEDISDAPAAC